MYSKKMIAIIVVVIIAVCLAFLITLTPSKDKNKSTDKKDNNQEKIKKETKKCFLVSDNLTVSYTFEITNDVIEVINYKEEYRYEKEVDYNAWVDYYKQEGFNNDKKNLKIYKEQVNKIEKGTQETSYDYYKKMLEQQQYQCD